jgi:hypothetical protein
MIDIKKNPETLNKLKVGTSSATPADGEVIADSLKVGSGDVSPDGSPTLLVTDTSAGGSVIVRGQSPILAFDKTSGGTATILTDGGGLNVKDGTMDSHGNTHLTISSTGNVSMGSTSSVYGRLFVDASTSGNEQNTALAVRGRSADASYLALNVMNSASDSAIFAVRNDGLATFSAGVNLGNSASATGTTLDHYEEGTWTPTYAPSSGSYTSLTMSVTSAKYTRVGDVCYVQAYIETDGTVNTSGGSGNLQISGLPFTSATGYGASFAVGYAANWGSNDVPLGGYVETGLAKITLSARSSVNGQQVSINFNNLDTGTDKNRLLFSGSYKVA